MYICISIHLSLSIYIYIYMYTHLCRCVSYLFRETLGEAAALPYKEVDGEVATQRN